MSGRHFAGSTKVLRRDEEAKKPPECAVVALAVAFMGPEWRRPPVFYFSSMMAADTEKAGHRLVALHAPGFCLCLHGAAAGTGGAPTDTGGAVRRGSDDARTGVLAAVPAWSNSPLLIDMNWSSELLNHAPAWGGNWLRWAKRGW